MKEYKTEAIRNLVLISHSGAGKTSLAEAILFNAGTINRLGKVDNGTTASDFDPAEIKKQISINLSLLTCEWKDNKINTIDTPGYPDFIGEVKAGLRAADTAVVLICATSGIEVGTELVWGYAEKQAKSRVLFINKIDRENADFYRVIDQVNAQFGSYCVPIQLPIGSQDKFEGVIDLITMRSWINNKEEDIPSSLAGDSQKYREKLMEALAEADDDICEKYLEGEEISLEELVKGLKKSIALGKLVPIMVGSALTNKAVHCFMNVICDYLPSPKDTEAMKITNAISKEKEVLYSDSTGPLAAQVFKTTADPYVGRLTYFRVYSGTMYSDSQVFNVNKNRSERIGQLLMVMGKEQFPVSQLVAGDIGGVAKLAETATGDSLCAQDHPLTFDAIEFPRPIFSAAVYPKTKADVDKLGTSLSRLCEEDPTLVFNKDTETNEMIVAGMGESHIEVALEKMQRKFGVDVIMQKPKVPFRETITTLVQTEYKHKKQTGGHGQYGHVYLELEPLPRGTGFEFTERVVGGSVPRNYFPAVEKGVNEGLHEGLLTGYPITDVRVTLFDGSSHPVDSSEMAFKIAALQAFKKGVNMAHPVLLEPIMSVQVTVPDSFMGDVIGDLNTKRARVLGMNPEAGNTVIDARVPLAEMLRYATDLRSLTQGRGQFTMELSHYEEVPTHITQKIIAEIKKDQ